MKVVVLALCACGLFALGFQLGMRNKPLMCPVVPGQMVISTMDMKEKQVCTYANAYGLAKKQLQLSKEKP